MPCIGIEAISVYSTIISVTALVYVRFWIYFFFSFYYLFLHPSMFVGTLLHHLNKSFEAVQCSYWLAYKIGYENDEV